MRIDGALHYTCEVPDLQAGKDLADRIAAMVESTYTAFDGKPTKLKIKGNYTDAVEE